VQVYRKISLVVLCAVMAAALSGCRSSGGAAGWNDMVERAKLVEVADSWVMGIEDYDVDAMAGPALMAAGFTLTITEGGHSYTKDLDTLRGEVEAAEPAQLEARQERGYVIRLDIDGAPVAGDLMPGEDPVNAWTIVNIGQDKADVAAFFEVFERADTVSVWRSDVGQIAANFIRSYGVWKLASMEIKFGPEHYSAADGATGAAVAVVGRPGGFGF
jgi:hypothetical protein